MPPTKQRNPSVVAVDQFMPSFVPGGMGGTETYAREVFAALRARPELSMRALVPQNATDFADSGETQVLPGVRTADSLRGRLTAALQVRLRTRAISRLFRSGAVRFVPFTTPIIAPRRLAPWVMTIHDVQHKELPELFSFAEKVYRWLTYELPARRADRIITISEFAKRGLVEHLGIAEEKISVIPLGVDTSRFVPNSGPRNDFVYYPARGWAHKNHARLVEAMRIVRETRPELRLVLTGGALDGLENLPEWVENRGLVSFTEVQDLLRQAQVLAFPSLYEGFGLPPLEAMASGTPVAASHAASIPEVCGDAAVYFDPTDPKSIARGILQAIEDRERLVPLGLARAQHFTWQACADDHAKVFREVVGQAR